MSHILSLTVVTKPGTHRWESAFNLLSTVALDVGKDFSSVTVHSQDMEDELELTGDLEEIEEYHDENTMAKVYDVIRKFVGPDHATDMVSSLQNAGILFREIRK